MALFDLSPNQSSETGVSIAIRHPKTNLPLGITVIVCGTDSATYKKIVRRQINSRLERSARNRNKQLSMTAEEIEAESTDIIVACTKSWSTGNRPEIELKDDEWLTCTPENVRRVLDDLPWLKEQIDQEIGDRNNFLKS